MRGPKQTCSYPLFMAVTLREGRINKLANSDFHLFMPKKNYE